MGVCQSARYQKLLEGIKTNLHGLRLRYNALVFIYGAVGHLPVILQIKQRALLEKTKQPKK
jgi:hypothetical protein